jgi:hypothetical protein
MRISVVVDDAKVIVDGEARTVDVSDLEPGIHAIQWDGADGDVEYGKPRRENVALADFAPYQFLLDRWVAAAPPPPPLPDPPIDQSDLDQLDKRMKALALCIAQVGNLTVLQMKTLFKQKWDALP